MAVQCPPDVRPGETIQVVVPLMSPGAAVEGVPVSPGVGAQDPPVVSMGVGVPGQPVGLHGQPYSYAPQVRLVEVEEISPAGWFCLIVGCFACPGFNLLGLCMRERRLVPVSEMHGGWS